MTKTLHAAFLAASLLAATSAQAAFDSCKQFFPDGAAPVVSATAPGRQRDLCFSSFAVLHSGQSKTPIYVVERLSRERLQAAKEMHRTDRFYEEARVPLSERAQLRDYKPRHVLIGDKEFVQHFDRGHQAPAGDMADPESMAQSFSLANMVPQTPEMNRKPWADVEKATRKYVMRAKGDVFVFTGPVYSGAVDTTGPGKVWIPSHLFKLVYDPSTNRAWAHWMENSNEARIGRPISYAELVRRTGTQFLPNRILPGPAQLD